MIEYTKYVIVPVIVILTVFYGVAGLVHWIVRNV